jgi:hypothetical protein
MRWIAFPLLASSWLTMAVAAMAGERCPFVLLDATLYEQKAPGVMQLPKAHVIDRNLWDKQDWERVPDGAIVARAVESIPAGAMVVLDFEHWATAGEDELVARSAAKYAEVIRTIRSANPAIRIGLYGAVPVPDYWRATGGHGPEARAQWIRDNDRVAHLASLVDFFAPSLYTFYEDRAGWERYAIAHIAEARRLAPTKPIYPFIWPEFHDSTPLRGTFLSGPYWAMELAVLRKLADGAVIWGGWDHQAWRKRKWNEAAEWWTETRKFLTDGRCGQGAAK